MPLASSIDLVIAGARVIVHALNNPSSGSPLAPLTDSEATVLHDLSELLTNRKPTQAALPQPAAILRVEPPVCVPPGFPAAPWPLHPQNSQRFNFSLVMDDFGVQYINRADADPLASTLTSLYTITTNSTGSTYLGLTLDWDYEARTCDVSIPGYISRALQRFAIPAPTKAQHSPHAWKKPNYGAKTQLTEPADVSAPLPPEDRKHLQEVISVLLYYGRAVNFTILVALGMLAATQAQGTQATAEACTHLLNFCATHSDAVIRYTASDMVLHVHSDASYLSEPKARSLTGRRSPLSQFSSLRPATASQSQRDPPSAQRCDPRRQQHHETSPRQRFRSRNRWIIL